jgi:aspartate/methionine/tyrosine aminotransferase
VHIADFKIERYFAQWEFAVPYVLGASDVEGYRLQDLLALADDETRQLWDALTLGYTESQGHPRLRAEIATLYDANARANTNANASANTSVSATATVAIGADDVLVSNPVEAIFLFAHAALQPGDHAIVVWPAYQALYEAARSAQADVTLLPLSPETGWQLDLDALRAALRPNTRAIVINSPHNPTGAMIDARTFDAIVAIAREAKAWLFSDEMYRFLEFDESARLPACANVYERGLSLGGMSKSFAMGGARIGWLATRDRALLERIARLKDYTSICCSAPSEILALIALRARDRVLARSREIVLANLDRVDRFFAKWPDVFTWVRPRGGSIAFPALRSDWPVDQFAQTLVEREGVLIVPASVFEFPGNHFRLGLGRVNLPDALNRVERLLSHDS